MHTREQVETSSVSEETKGSDTAHQTESVKLVEMGQVSVETKGIIRGLELGFTPKN